MTNSMETEIIPSMAKIDKGKGKAKIPTKTKEEEEEEGNKKKESLPWVEKYRPDTLNDLISQQSIIKTITQFIDQKKLPHLLFYGPPGTGKTSTILACAKKMYGMDKYKSMTLELNASDERGIDVVREQIISFASTKNMFDSLGYKLIILDEADHMTTTAQAALRRVMEKFTKNVRFCLVCNYISKIIPAIQSRCTRFRFEPLLKENVKQRLEYIVMTEQVQISDGGMNALLELTKGDMRRALNILQSVNTSCNGVRLIEEKDVYETTGNPLPREIEQIFKFLIAEQESDFATILQSIQQLKMQRGLSLADLITELYQYTLKTQFPNNTKCLLVKGLAEIEYRLAQGCTERIQLGSLVGLYQEGKEISLKSK